MVNAYYGTHNVYLERDLPNLNKFKSEEQRIESNTRL